MNLTLNVKNINEIKTDTKTTRAMEYVIPGHEEETPIKVTYKPIRNGEMPSFFTPAEDGGSINMRLIFSKKVVKIENFSILDREGNKKELKNADDVLSLPLIPEIEVFIGSVFGRIYNESLLTEDEEKNSESATSA